ncbi:fatty acid--CoA ligase [Rhizobium indigoferae]|uniref:Fatty acid--CoA ligase n=1 Tax=Rhizobium indigoferae TaxID=158891 RepID=A0ABZ1DT18_9HYPH|nr:fatty acid--CoA ligase [Rhizobium indigoferae]NNU52594.1 fatty acid--CoA ligase [Rhizobium indigoferae]WRW39372.1 fatty acid--CoA ligase [Rhizobium indigoferae]GLR56752.1 AMP-binding protein [Rhizobium indigoferae]
MTGKLMQVVSSAHSYPLLIKQLWHTTLQQAPDQVIVYRDIARFTYRELRERIGRLASALERLGVDAGDTVGVLDWDSNRFLEAYFAVPMMGAVLQTVNVRLSPEQIAYTIDHANTSVLLVNDEFVPMLEGIRQQLPKIRTLIVMSDRTVPQTGGLTFAGEYEDLLRGASPGYDFPDFDENRLATTFYTTGTSGPPKGVSFSHRQLVLHSLAEMAFLGAAAKQGRLCRDDVYMPITPMFHAHAWGLPWTATLSGVKQVYPGRYDPAVLLKLIKTEGVTFTHCVPTILQRLLAAAAAADTDLTGLKMVIGGSELPKALARQALALGVDVFAGYGMSESAPLLCLSQVRSADLSGDPEAEAEIRTRAGLAAPLVDLRLVDAGRNEVPPDGKTQGEIVLRAPWLTQGYIGNADASDELWVGGYMRTGDVGIIGPDGYLRIVDRIKDVIKTGGEWVSSLQIEDLLSQREGVSEAAVIGVKDEQWGERPLALVVRDERTGRDLTDTQLKAHLKGFVEAGVISKYGIPDTILFVEALPKTSVGKFNKNELRHQYGSG